MTNRGVMICLEGVDGAGKTGTQSFLASELRRAGFAVETTREPGGTDGGIALRSLLLAESSYDWTPTAELLLMNASRRQHLDQLILPSLEAGKIVICDRFVGSTLAYQGGGRGLSRPLILDLHRLTMDDFWPDLTLVLDLDPSIALTRSRVRLQASQTDEGRFESLDLAFHQRVRESFLEQAGHFPGYRVIDANRPPDAVQQEALSHVEALLRIQARG